MTEREAAATMTRLAATFLACRQAACARVLLEAAQGLAAPDAADLSLYAEALHCSGVQEEALAVVDRIEATVPPALSRSVALLRVEILTELGRATAARQALAELSVKGDVA